MLATWVRAPHRNVYGMAVPAAGKVTAGSGV
jgi:hypothetical protein